MRLLPVVAFAAVAVVGCNSPEDKAKETAVGNWHGNVVIVGAPPVEVKLTLTAAGQYTETRTVQGMQGMSIGGTYAVAGTKAITLTPSQAPPPNPLAALPAARALLPLSGTIVFHVYGDDKIRVGDIDLTRTR